MEPGGLLPCSQEPACSILMLPGIAHPTMISN